MMDEKDEKIQVKIMDGLNELREKHGASYANFYAAIEGYKLTMTAESVIEVLKDLEYINEKND